VYQRICHTRCYWWCFGVLLIYFDVLGVSYH